MGASPATPTVSTCRSSLVVAMSGQRKLMN
jgi:hypothetical protein